MFWGVDSAQNVNDELLSCVNTNFGYPDFWGRYMNTIPNASEGLTREELRYLKAKGIKVLPIFNNFQGSVGKQAAKVAARNSIYNATRLGIRKGTVLFARMWNPFLMWMQIG